VRGAEGTFSACSFWYVEALARAGRLDEARLAFEKMLTYTDHVGLYAEQISRGGQQQGNFLEARTHLALISAAFNLDRASARESPGSGDDRSPARRRGSVRRGRLARPRGCARQYSKIRAPR